MAKRVFISRDVSGRSPFRQLLTTAGFEVLGKSLLEFTPIEFNLPPTADWVFYYSARSAGLFLAGLQRMGIPRSRYPQTAAMGAGTAMALKELQVTVDFIGKGEPSAVAKSFGALAAGKRVLFPRAEQSRQSIQRLLSDEIEVLDVVVYRNQIREDIVVPVTDYIVFTSPLNVQAYLAATNLQQHSRIVLIGSTTAEALSAKGAYDYRIAAEPNERALAQTILAWENE